MEIRKSLIIAALLLLTGVIHLGSYSVDRPNIAIITLESTRADHLPCYGYHRDTMPNVCRVAQDGVTFENGYSSGAFTLPSISSMHTSKYPKELGTLSPGDTLPKNVSLLAESLKKEGYNTYGVVHTYHPTEKIGFSKGFDYYEDNNSIDSVQTVRKATNTINTSSEFFAWIHLVDPHQGYSAPENFSGTFAHQNSTVSADQTAKEFTRENLSEEEIQYIRDRYDEELLYADYAFGKFIKWLKDKEEYQDSLIIIVGDHGEDLMEHGHIGHGFSLRDVYTHVPFIVKFPENRYANTKVQKPVSLVDILPTIKDRVDIESSTFYRGTSLYEIIEGKSSRKGIITQMVGKNAFVTSKWKLIDQEKDLTLNSKGEHVLLNKSEKKLFNLDKDRLERKNLAEQKPEIVQYLQKRMYQRLERDLNNTYERIDPYGG